MCGWSLGTTFVRLPSKRRRSYSHPLPEFYSCLDFPKTESKAEREGGQLNCKVCGWVPLQYFGPSSAVLKSMTGFGLLAISRAPPGRAAGLLMPPSLTASLFLQHYASPSAFFQSSMNFSWGLQGLLQQVRHFH